MRKVAVVMVVAVAGMLVATTASAQVTGKAELTVQAAVLRDPNGLTATGTIGCALGSDFMVFVAVTELGTDSSSVKQSDKATGPCTVDGPQTWTVTVEGSGGDFVPVVTTFGTISDPVSRETVSNVDQRGITFAR